MLKDIIKTCVLLPVFFIVKTKLSCFNIKMLLVNLPDEWSPILTQLAFKSCVVSKFSDQMYHVISDHCMLFNTITCI